jgi:hypothetical protein
MSKENECTLVTAYFEFPIKKFSSNTYLNWINNFLPNTNAYMVIFTDEQSYDTIYNLRKNHIDRTKIITLTLSDFYCYKYMYYWNKDHIRDHEKAYHHQYLYMIWSEKSNFIKLSIELNPFDTEFYMWCDIGMIRDVNCIKYISNFPNKEVIKDLKKDKVYLLNITEFTEEDLKINDATEIFRYQNNSVRIGGGGIFGNVASLKIWIRLYYEMLDEFIKRDYFAGKDQSIMTCVYLKNKDLIELVKHKPCPFNHWFYMIYYLS